MTARAVKLGQPTDVGAASVERQHAFERAIERRIVQRTWGRIQALEVEASNERIIVRGRATSYYIEQLALRGVLDIVETTGATRIELKIQVGSPPSGCVAHCGWGEKEVDIDDQAQASL